MPDDPLHDLFAVAVAIVAIVCVWLYLAGGGYL